MKVEARGILTFVDCHAENPALAVRHAHETTLPSAASDITVPHAPNPFSPVEPDLRSLRRDNVANDDRGDGAHLEG